MVTGQENVKRPAAPGKSAVQRLHMGIAGLLIALVTVTVVLAISHTWYLKGFDIDALHWLREQLAAQHADPATSSAVVVAIDEASYVAPELAGKPSILWTPHMAEVQNAVLENGAAVYGWDIILPTSPAAFVADKRFDTPLLLSLRKYGLKQGRLLLGKVSFGVFDSSGNVEDLQPFPGYRRQVGGEPNIRSLLAHPDPDGGVRGVPYFVQAKDQHGEVGFQTGMAMELASRLTGKPAAIEADGTVKLGDTALPSYGNHAVLLNFDTGIGAIPTFSFADLLACAQAGNSDYFKRHFEGKAVLFGLVSNLDDRKVSSNRFVTHPDFHGAPAPCSEGYKFAPAEARTPTPGVYLHATAINNIVRNNPLQGAPLWLEILCVLSVAGAIVTFALRYRPQKSAPLAVIIGGVWVVIATAAFRETYILPLSAPLLAGILCLGASIGYRFISTDKERALIHEAFKFYLDPSVIDEMIDSGAPPVLGGETREVSVLFSDIAGFSSFSENLPPEDLISFLNEYFNIFDEALRDRNGILDKYIGDAVMAIFGAPKDDPNHARNAVSCCLGIQKRLAESQHVFKEYLVNLPEGTEVVTRLGVNSGVMTVGNVGGAQRANYTVFGDNVNLAARLESVNKQFGTTLLVGDTTWEQCKDDFEWRVIDRVRVVGRDTPVTLREPLGEKGTVSQEVLVQRDQFEAGLQLRWSRKFDDAIGVFDALAGKGDKAAAYARDRTREMLASPPSGDWDGVLDLDKK